MTTAIATDRVEVQIPFAGFYYSWHSEECDRPIDDLWENRAESYVDPVIASATQKEWDDATLWAFDYGDIYREYAEDYARTFCDSLGIRDIEFGAMESPLEYNFATDRIFVTIPRAEADRLRAQWFDSSEFRENVRKHLTGRDGFIPHFDNTTDSEDWTRDTWDAVQWSILLDVAITSECGDEWELSVLEAMPSVYENAAINDAIAAISAYIAEHKESEA